MINLISIRECAKGHLVAEIDGADGVIYLADLILTSEGMYKINSQHRTISALNDSIVSVEVFVKKAKFLIEL